MKQKVHNYTAQPAYDGRFSWTGEQLDHNADRDARPYPHPVVFDIETTAETPQRPIFIYAIDDLDERAYIAYNPEKLSSEFDGMTANQINQWFKQQTDYETEVYNYVGPQFMDDLINLISEFNEQGDINKTLVGHNVFFDLGLTAKPNPELLELDSFDADEWDGAMAYNDNAVLHKRAGANGRLYQFTDGNNRQYVPVTDTMVCAGAMRLRSGLEDLCDDLGLDGYYEDDDQEHGELTKQYIDYALNDVEMTLSVFSALRTRLRNMFNTSMNLNQIYSTASIGKQKMREMGYDRVDYTPKAAALCARRFFGGQTETLKPGELVENQVYLDFLSQYPTAAALTGMQRFQQAEKVRANEIDPGELPEPEMDDFRKPDTWEDCADYLVTVKADNAMLPVRVEADIDRQTKVLKGRVTTDVGSDKSDAITLNNDGDLEDKQTITQDAEGVPYHYLDVLGAMYYDDCEIEIIEAYEMAPQGKQDLTSTSIGGMRVDAYANLMRRTIELRKRIQYEQNDGEKDVRTLANKIVANSLFGVSAERILQKHNVETDEDGEEIIRYDQAGTYYNPMVGTTITAAGRLMLTLGELVAERNGAELAYCDTDSLIIDQRAADAVMNWFNEGLNPYDGVAGEQDFLEIEDYEVSDDKTVDLEGVDIYAVGVKKYVIVKDGKILMNKEHGLGHFEQLRNTEENPDRTKKFWGALLNELDVLGRVDRLKPSEMREMVTWQTAASTEEIRSQMDNLVPETVRYGDFIKRSINPKKTGEIIQYIGINLDEKAVKVVKNGSDVQSIEVVDEMHGEHLKTIADVLNDWMVRVQQATTGRESYEITGLRAVTKESSDLKRAWDDEQTGYFATHSDE